ncbi:MAG TPA: YceI family protein [Acidimicrobiales bacterium]|jgi:polyisoprenoid-binding protein YceI|nr:YceI family protein [Acidimicrobiales bacterium]HJM27975.1 YceI family protein [Acidimicrobiales bacterium]HJM97918.1 YceI family protein [Acidimicrobiales bacterium]
MEEEINSNDRSSKAKWFARCLLLACVLFLLAWVFIFRDTSPADVNSQAAKEAREEALAEVEASQVETLNGVWIIDTEIGVFNEACLTEVCGSTFVGFRIDEELVGIGGKTVVGRTPGIDAQFTIEGTRLLSSGDTNIQEGTPIVVVDMTRLITDDAGRNNAIRRQAIETEEYPEASFFITESIDFSSETDLETGFITEVVGDLTIHGITRQETVILNVSFDGSRVLVFGEISPIRLADYGIEKPRSAVVLSVNDEAIMEFQLYFKKLN